MNSMTLIDLETRAARIAASLDARPQIGAIWRRLTAISEAAATLGLEDIVVHEADIVRPALHIGVTQGEPQSVTIARGIHRALLRPASILEDPGAAFDRAYTTAYMSQIIIDEDGPRVDYPTGYEVDDWEQAREAFASVAREILKHPAPITLRALEISKLAAEVTPQRYPMAERLLFSAAESDMRRDLVFSDPVISRSVEGLDRRIDASWVMLPSAALSRDGFRAWSPTSQSGRATLIDRLHKTLGREAGRIGQISSWHERLHAEFQGKNRKSRKTLFVSLISETPVVNGGVVAEALDITERSARRLIEEAAEMGLLKPLTNRKIYRVWAVPVLADMIQERAHGRPQGSHIPESKQADHSHIDNKEHRRLHDADFDARVAIVLDELDDAIAGADRVMAKYKVNSSVA